MALTKVTGHVVKPDTNIQFHNTKSTGIVTFAHTDNATSSTTGALQITGGVGIVKDLHVGGNITVGGTLTYDDVTNIDSLGIITARGGIHVGPPNAGVATVSSNGSASFTGILTTSSTLFAKDFSTSGIGTFADIHVKSNADDTRITSIAPGALILSRTTPVIYLKNNLSDTFDASIELQSNEIRFRGGGNNATGIRMETTSSGVSFPQNIDVDGHTELDNTSIVGVATVTGNFNVVNGTILQTKTGGSTSYTISRNESVGTTNQVLGVIDFASNTAHTVQARLMGKSLGTSNVGGDLVIETRAEGGSLDERVRITGGGSILVNTTVDTQASADGNEIIIGSTSNTHAGLSIVGSTSGGVGNIFFSDGASYKNQGLIQYRHADDSMRFSANQNERIRIESTGKIVHTNFSGIGLLMEGSGDPTIQISDTDGTNQYLQLAHNGGDSYVLTRNNTTHGEFLIYSSNGSENKIRFKVRQDGNVGINTGNPQNDLDVYGHSSSANGPAPVVILRNGASGTANQSNALKSELRVLHANHNDAHEFMASRIITETTDNYMQRTYLRFLVANANNGTERLTIDPYGKVGINTNSPTLNGSEQGIHIVSVNYPTLHLTNSTTGHGANNGSLFTLNNSGETIIRNGHNSHIRFDTNDGSSIDERLRILANGHVNIGDDIANDTGMFKVRAADGDSDDQYVGQFDNLEATAGRSYGVNIRAGSNSTDHGFRVMNRANDTTQFLVRGDDNIGVNESSPQRYFHATGNASTGCAHFGVFGTNAGNAYIGNTPVVTISTDGGANAGTNDEKAIFQVGRGGGGAGAAAVTTEHLRVNLGGTVQIGGAVVSNSHIDIQNTKLTIKQSANNREDGLYIERSGEGRGWLQYVGGAGGVNDGFCLSTNQLGSKMDVLAFDRNGRMYFINNNGVGAWFGALTSPTSDTATINAVSTSDKEASIGLSRASSLGGTAGGWRISIQDDAEIAFNEHNSGSQPLRVRNRITRAQYGIDTQSNNGSLYTPGRTGFHGTQWTNCGPMFPFFYSGERVSSSSSNYSFDFFDIYASGHWNGYPKAIIMAHERYYKSGFTQWTFGPYNQGSYTLEQVESWGGYSGGHGTDNAGTVTITDHGQTNTHSGQPVRRWTVTCANTGNYSYVRWYVGFIHTGRGVYMSNTSQTDVNNSTTSGACVHMRDITQAAAGDFNYLS